MKLPNKTKPFLITLSLCCAAPLSAAEAEPAAEPAAAPVTWHVPTAELRVPVKVEVNAALLRMPPQVYLADLKPLETTHGLAFDPQSKDVIRVDIRDPKEKAATIAKEKKKYEKAGKKWDPKAYGRMLEHAEGGPMLRVKGSVTVALKPEYKFFTWRSANGKVFIDGKLATPHRIGSRHWQRGETFWREHGGEVGRREGSEISGGRDVVDGGLVTIPAGAKTLKLERVPDRWHHHLRQAGFITRYAKVAHATISFPGRDPSRLVPVAYRANGQRVGCRVVWASESEPMTIMFDSSSGDEDYWVYLVDQASAPAPLDWTPQAEIVQEIRQLDRYNPEVETLAGFEKLWASAAIVGRGIPQTRSHEAGLGRLKPRRTIYQGTPPFRQKASRPFNLHELAGSQPATLGRFSGTFHIPATGFYRFFCMSGPGGYVLLDGQLVASFRGVKSGRLFAIEIEKGQHRIEMLQYGPTGQVGFAGLWWKDSDKNLNGDYTIGWPLFGSPGLLSGDSLGRPNYMLWEPLADTMTAPLEHRSKDAWATFSWYQLAQQKGVYPGIGYPKYALNWYRFSAHAPGASAAAVYRWEFDDGRTAEGKQISKLFLRSGIRKVQLEVLDAPGGKVVARAAGEVAVQMSVADWHEANLLNYANSRQDIESRAPFSPLVEQLWAFAEEDRLERLPLDDLVNFYEWLNSTKGYVRGHGFYLNGDAWTPPTDEQRMETFDYAVESYRVARRRSRDVLAGRVDELIAAYRYSELLRLAQGFSRAERRPTAAHYAAAEKLLDTVLERAPAGSSYWRTAALALSDIKLSVRGDTESAAAWLEKFEQTKPAVDMLESWQFAEARQYHHLADTDQLAGPTAGLDWSPIERPRHLIGYNVDNYQPLRRRTPQQAMSGFGWSIPFKNNRGFWLAQDFDLPADWNGSHLVFRAGLPRGYNGVPIQHVWINGEPLGRMWQWLDRNIVIPEKLLKKGGKNRITWLFQPYPWAQHVQQASPVLSADLNLRVQGDGPHIFLNKGHQAKSLGQLMVVGVLPDISRSFAFSAAASGCGTSTSQ